MSTQRTHPLVLALAVVIAAVVLSLAYASYAYPEHLREYRLYVLEKRPPLDFSFEDLSQDLTERTLAVQFAGKAWNCRNAPSTQDLGDRVCYLDIAQHNEVAAMAAAFYFKDGTLSFVSIHVPTWAHSSMNIALLKKYGGPAGYQPQPFFGVRLKGWQLANGSALFYNRDRDPNPLMWSAILWASQRTCQAKACFTRLPSDA
jgi:hypothetical protein